MFPLSLWVTVFLLHAIDVCEGLTYYFGNGSYYEGDVDHYGRPSGMGQFFTKEGDLTYNGSFYLGNFHGKGEWYGPTGHTYTGDFEYGEANGEGVWITPHSDFISGTFRNHSLHGSGEWYFPSTSQYMEKMQGTFMRGLAEGDSVVTYRNGNRLEVGFKKGYPHGDASLYNAREDEIWSGEFWNGAPITPVSADWLRPVFAEFHRRPLRLQPDREKVAERAEEEVKVEREEEEEETVEREEEEEEEDYEVENVDKVEEEEEKREVGEEN